MPFAESYAPRCCTRKYERRNSEGNLMAESAKWDRYLKEAFADAQEEADKNGESSGAPNEPNPLPEERQRGSGPQGKDDLAGDP